MATNSTKTLVIRGSILLIGLLVLVAATIATRAYWLPLVQRGNFGKQEEGVASEPDSHEGHDHAAHAGHTEATSLELSPSYCRKSCS